MNDADRELLDHFVRTREKTLELARRVPDDWLGRTPDGESAPLDHLLWHAGAGETWWMGHVLCDGAGGGAVPPMDKAALVTAIEAARDRVVAFFGADDGTAMGRTFSFVDESAITRQWTGRNRLLYFIDHEVHHRGKIVLALRQWGCDDITFLPF